MGTWCLEAACAGGYHEEQDETSFLSVLLYCNFACKSCALAVEVQLLGPSMRRFPRSLCQKTCTAVALMPMPVWVAGVAGDFLQWDGRAAAP